MTADQLAFYSGWASIISLIVALLSLALLGSIRSHMVRLRRKQRSDELTQEIAYDDIPASQLPYKLEA